MHDDHAVERRLAALQRRLPGMRVETIRTLDPQDFAHQRHLYEGALYGIAPGVPPPCTFHTAPHFPACTSQDRRRFPASACHRRCTWVFRPRKPCWRRIVERPHRG